MDLSFDDEFGLNSIDSNVKYTESNKKSSAEAIFDEVMEHEKLGIMKSAKISQQPAINNAQKFAAPSQNIFISNNGNMKTDTTGKNQQYSQQQQNVSDAGQDETGGVKKRTKNRRFGSKKSQKATSTEVRRALQQKAAYGIASHSFFPPAFHPYGVATAPMNATSLLTPPQLQFQLAEVSASPFQQPPMTPTTALLSQFPLSPTTASSLAQAFTATSTATSSHPTNSMFTPMITSPIQQQQQNLQLQQHMQKQQQQQRHQLQQLQQLQQQQHQNQLQLQQLNMVTYQQTNKLLATQQQLQQQQLQAGMDSTTMLPTNTMITSNSILSSGNTNNAPMFAYAAYSTSPSPPLLVSQQSAITGSHSNIASNFVSLPSPLNAEYADVIGGADKLEEGDNTTKDDIRTKSTSGAAEWRAGRRSMTALDKKLMKPPQIATMKIDTAVATNNDSSKSVRAAMSALGLGTIPERSANKHGDGGHSRQSPDGKIMLGGDELMTPTTEWLLNNLGKRKNSITEPETPSRVLDKLW